MNDCDFSYIAGLFDGEGSIHISKVRPQAKNREVNPRFFLVIEIANTDLDVLQWIKIYFGGRIFLKTGRKSWAKPCYALQWSKLQAEHFIKTISRYLRIKQSQVSLAIEFQEYRKSLLRRKSARPPHEIAMFERFRETMQHLNGVKAWRTAKEKYKEAQK